MLRAVVVDDNDDVRLLLRMALRADRGFEVVGEAGNGLEAVEVAAATRPDLVILDRDMPVATGLEVLPRIRQACPQALIVLYTAHADAAVREAAIAAGADQIRDKLDQPVTDLVRGLADVILESRSAPGDTVELRLGPIDADIAHRWVSSTSRLIAALRASPDEVPPGVTEAELDEFDRFLQEWSAVAEAGGTFHWAAAAAPETVERLVGAWAQIDRLSDDAMARLGCSWSGPDARPFFDELTRAVVAALEASEELDDLRTGLPPGWGGDQPDAG